MKKLTRKLFISILSMAFAVIAIGTTTFAWITISNTADVNAFEGKVETGDGGIELSLNYNPSDKTGDWTNILNVSENDFNKFATTGFSDITWDGNIFQELTITDNKASYASVNSESKPYIEFTFYIKNTNPSGGNLEVKIDSSKVLFGHAQTDSGSYTPDVEVNGNKTLVTNLFVDNAARMKIEADGNTLLYQKVEGTDGNTLGAQTEGWAQKYFVAKGISFNGLEAPAGLTIFTSGSDDQVIISSLGETPVPITVCVWVEGWDAECHAQILKQTLTAALGFTATKAPASQGTN